MNYSGKVLINTRSIKPIEDILSSKNPPQGEQLNQLLSFLTTYSLSNGLLYDNTVPEQFLVPAFESLTSIGLNNDLRATKSMENEEFEKVVSETLSHCNNEIFQSIKYYDKYKPVDTTNTSIFYQLISCLKKEKGWSTRQEIAYEAYNSDIMGAKLLLALTNPINEDLFLRITSLKLTENQKPQVLSAIIGTYRTFLLSNIASINDALFSTNPEFVTMLEKRNIKSWGLLMKEFNTPTGLAKSESNNTKWQWSYPLVGAAIIIDAGSSRSRICPKELFVFSRKSDSYNKISSIYKGLLNRYICAESSEDLVREMEDCWKELLMKNGNKDYKEIFRSGLKYSIAPSIVGGFTPMVLDSIKFDAIPFWAINTSIGVLFLLYQCYAMKKNYFNAISTLSSYNESVETLLRSSLNKIWSV